MRWLGRIIVFLVLAVGVVWRLARAMLDLIGQYQTLSDLLNPYLSPISEWIAKHPNWDAFGPWALIGAACIALIAPYIVAWVYRAYFVSPLEIIFDPTNPDGRYWSDEMWRRPNGDLIGYGTEYRFEIRNRGRKTLSGVTITQEHLGGVSSEQTTLIFKRTNQESCDIHPMSSEFVKAFLITHEVQEMPMREEDRPKSGVIIRARARDLPEVKERWRLDHTQTPAVYAEWPL